METIAHKRSLRAIVRALEAETLARDYPSDAVARAGVATLRALGDGAQGPGLDSRARAYFHAVLRRQTARMGGTAAAARLVVEAVVGDLISSGRSRLEALDELERGWSKSLPAAVLEEYRERMCA